MSDSNVNVMVPHPRLTTFNITSLSSNPSSGPSCRRWQRVLRTLEALLSRCDILCLQEVKLGRYDQVALSNVFRSHKIYYNNLKLGRAGTMILVSAKFASCFDISETPLPARAQGRVQALFFKSKKFPNVPKASFNLINVYLTSGEPQSW